MSVEVKVDVKKLYKRLCPECKKKLEEMVEKDIAKAAAKQFLGDEK